MKILILSIIATFSLPTELQAKFTAHEVMTASKGKHNVYVMDATIRGGDSNRGPGSLSNIRWARKYGFERIVIDISGSETNWRKKLPPYFQVGLNPNKGLINLSIHNIARFGVNSTKVAKIFSDSGLIKAAYLAPPSIDQMANLEFRVSTPVDVEAFYLTGPPRIILDIRAK